MGSGWDATCFDRSGIADATEAGLIHDAFEHLAPRAPLPAAVINPQMMDRGIGRQALHDLIVTADSRSNAIDYEKMRKYHRRRNKRPQGIFQAFAPRLHWRWQIPPPGRQRLFYPLAPRRQTFRGWELDKSWVDRQI